MIDIPMKAKGAVHTSELKGMNRAKPSQTLQRLTRGQSAQTQRAPSSAQPAPNRRAPSPAQPAPNRRAPSPVQPARNQSVPRTPSPPSPGPILRRQHPLPSGTLLQKGQKISLSQLDPALELIDAGLGWELNANGQKYELDVEAFLLNASGKVLGDNWFVFYNQPTSPDGAVRLLDAHGPGPRDDAVIQVDLCRLSPNVAKIVLIVTINEALENGYHFGNVTNAYVRVVNRSARRELVRFQLTDYYSNVCSMMVGEIYRYKNEWRFNPVGNGTGEGLAGLCIRYGVNI